jgi:hypothetical protein
VFAIVGRAVVFCAICFAFEFHWLALQSVAWTTMLVTNARQGSLCEAVTKTFDGAHPCKLCHAVSSGQKSEKKSQTPLLFDKIDLVCLVRTLCFEPWFEDYSYQSISIQVTERSLSPPVPPPRFAAV